MSADFVAHMEDVLDLYSEPYDPARPVVCFDESSTQLLAETRAPLPAAPGRPRRQDYEYVRGGTCNLFLTCEPKAGWRHVAITRQRTMQDFAQQMHWLVDQAYPDVPVVRVVLDNLNTHRMASLYETFPPAEARRIAQWLEFHYTPKHGSWLNIACPGVGRGQRLSSACWPGPVCGDATRRGQSGEGRERKRVGAQGHGSRHQLALHCQGRQTQTPPPLPVPFLI